MERQAVYEIKRDEIATSPGQLPPTPSGSIEEAAQRIIELDARARSIACDAKTNTQAALEKAYECGLWLCYAKGKVRHGDWLPWLSQLGVSKHTSARYMKLAESNVADRLLLNARNLTHAMELAGVRKPEPAKPTTDTSTKTRLPDTIEAIALDFARWKRNDFDKRIDAASDTLLLAWYQQLKPMAEAFKVVEARLR